MNNLIYDRTQLDIDNLTSKAYYNYNDLNRIEQWCEYLSARLNDYNYFVSINIKTNWTIYDFPTNSEMERIRSNISTLKKAYFSFTEVPKNLEYMTWKKANDIEKILAEIDNNLLHMENHFVYCGVSNCGQNRIWQQRFRRKYTYIVPISWDELAYTYWNDINEDDTWEEVAYGATNYEL